MQTALMAVDKASTNPCKFMFSAQKLKIYQLILSFYIKFKEFINRTRDSDIETLSFSLNLSFHRFYIKVFSIVIIGHIRPSELSNRALSEIP